MRRGLLFTSTLLVVIYAADYVAARSNPLGSIQVQPYLAIHLKNKKTEFDFNVPEETQNCVQSLAPHLGYPPCWYVKRKTIQRVDE
jgi:hypothetical protein